MPLFYESSKPSGGQLLAAQVSSQVSNPLLRAMEILGQQCQQRRGGAWVVSAPCEPTEWPAFELAFNNQLQGNWQQRVSSRVSVIVDDSTIPVRIRGKKDDSLWDAMLETVVVEHRELVAYFSVEVVR
jgi:hypothetical protein